jgi:hypothetical protein
LSPRRIALATSIMLAALSPFAHAAGTKPLDGKRRTHVRYTSNLQDPAVNTQTDRVRTDLLTPTLEDCTKTSCDITQLRLTLPANTTWGAFDVTLTVPRELNVYVALYDAKGAAVHSVEPVDPNDDDCCTDYLPPCCDSPDTTYVVDFSIGRLRAGTYTLVVYDRGGFGVVTTDVSYRALHPDRQPPRK